MKKPLSSIPYDIMFANKMNLFVLLFSYMIFFLFITLNIFFDVIVL